MELKAGLDFLAALPDDEERTVEAFVAPNIWWSHIENGDNMLQIIKKRLIILDAVNSKGVDDAQFMRPDEILANDTLYFPAT